MKIINLKEVDSTMNVVKNYDFNTLVVAEKQTLGRGKDERVWVSEKSNNIYMSILINANNEKINYFNYSFLSAISILKTIEVLTNGNINLKVKWPNDVLINNKKFCGILLEKDGNKLIIGIGINVDYYPENVLFNASSLKKERINLEKSEIINKFVEIFEKFSNKLQNTNNFEEIRQIWLNYAYNLGKKIKISGKNEIEGIFKDLDNEGSLIVEDENGKIHKIFSGDIF